MSDDCTPGQLGEGEGVLGVRRKLAFLGVLTMVTAGSLTAAGGSPAAAAGIFGCEFPRVCLYKTSSDWLARRPTASYRDLTADGQRLGPRGRHSYAVYNSRFDDAAWLFDTDGTAACVAPDSTWFSDKGGEPSKIIALQIVDEPDCFGG